MLSKDSLAVLTFWSVQALDQASALKSWRFAEISAFERFPRAGFGGAELLQKGGMFDDIMTASVAPSGATTMRLQHTIQPQTLHCKRYSCTQTLSHIYYAQCSMLNAHGAFQSVILQCTAILCAQCSVQCGGQCVSGGVGRWKFRD